MPRTDEYSRPRLITKAALAAIGGAVVWSCASLFPSEARASCIQTGSNVDCSGNDFDGFRSLQSLTIQIRPGTFIQNLITGDRFGICPLSFPAIATGASSTVVNEGVISTAGVCGFGVAVGSNSSVVNFGTIRTSDFISYGILADDGSAVRNGGTITTEFDASAGLFGGRGVSVVVESGGRISTTGSGASGIEVGAESSVTNDADITTSGSASHGINAASGSTVVNGGSISTSANNSAGVRIEGGNLTNTGSIRSILVGPAFALTPTVGVSIGGNFASFTNTVGAVVTATHIGVRLSGTQSNAFSNNGRIDVFPVVQFDGTPSANSAAVVIAGSAGVAMTNAGTIVAHGGLPALRSLGAPVELRNTGSIVGDVILGAGNDLITFEESSSINGSIDFGAGDDTIIFRSGGVLDRPIANLERLSKSGATALIFARDITVSQQVNVLGGGGIVIERGTRLAAALTDNIGIVRGHGTLAGDLGNGGTVAPGTASERGTLTLTGAFRQLASGTLAVRLSPDGTSDKLVVGGPVTLAGTLAISFDAPPGGTPFQDGQRFDVLAPVGSALISVGQFAVAAPQRSFFETRLVRTPLGGYAVEIDRRSYDTAGTSRNQRSAGGLLDRMLIARSPTLSDVFMRLETATPTGANSILAGLAPESPGGVQNLSLMALDQFAESVQGRTSTTFDTGRRVWTRGFSSSGRSRDLSSTADYNLRGGAAGIEIVREAFGLGVAAARIEGDFARGSDRANYDASLFGVTTSYGTSRFKLDAAFMYGAGSPEVRRVRPTNGGSEMLTAVAGVDFWSIVANGRLSRTFGPAGISPHIGLVYQRAHLDEVDERLPLSIRTAGATAKSMRGRAGMSVAASVGPARPFGDLSVSTEFLQRSPRISASIIGVGGSDFELYGDARHRVAVKAEAGISVALSSAMDAYVAGALTANDLLAGRTISAGLTIHW